MATTYDPAVQISFLDEAIAARNVYPDDVAHLSEIWAPRLYAKGLDTLELASSGRVAITAGDKHALDIEVIPRGEAGGAQHDHTYLNFANNGFTLATELQSILVTEPAADAVGRNNTTVMSNNVDIQADSQFTARAADVSLSATGFYSATAPELTMSATTGDMHLGAGGDVVLSAGGNATVTVKNDRIIVRGNIDIDGVVNSVALQTLQTLEVTDNFIEIADGLEHEVTDGMAGSQQGLRVNTVPAGAAATLGDGVDLYLRKFKAEDGLAFYTNNTFDQIKYNAANAVLRKGIIFNVAAGTSAGGEKTQASRGTEPYWDVTGGSMRLSRIVPSSLDGLLHKHSIAFRVTNCGELEFVQHRVPMTLVDGAYVEGDASPPQVVTRFGAPFTD